MDKKSIESAVDFLCAGGNNSTREALAYWAEGAESNTADAAEQGWNTYGDWSEVWPAVRDAVLRLRDIDPAVYDVVLDVGEFAHGGEPDRAARQWSEAGFDADDVAAWLSARCYSATGAQRLLELGYSPEQAAEVWPDAPGENMTIGYAAANGDL
jgi:hypothetical protein